MKTTDLIGLAVANYAPSTETVTSDPEREQQGDAMMQLATEAVTALVNVFGNDIEELLLVFRWQHERGELAILNVEPKEWFVGFTVDGEERYFGPYPSFDLAREGLMLLARKAMAAAFENYQIPRAAELRIVLDSLKDSELKNDNFANTISDDEKWFITKG